MNKLLLIFPIIPVIISGYINSKPEVNLLSATKYLEQAKIDLQDAKIRNPVIAEQFLVKAKVALQNTKKIMSLLIVKQSLENAKIELNKKDFLAVENKIKQAKIFAPSNYNTQFESILKLISQAKNKKGTELTALITSIEKSINVVLNLVNKE